MIKSTLIKFIKENTNKEQFDKVDDIPMLSKEYGASVYDCAQVLLEIQDIYDVPLVELKCLDKPLFTISDIVSDVINYYEGKCNYEKVYEKES